MILTIRKLIKIDLFSIKVKGDELNKKTRDGDGISSQKDDNINNKNLSNIKNLINLTKSKNSAKTLDFAKAYLFKRDFYTSKTKKILIYLYQTFIKASIIYYLI